MISALWFIGGVVSGVLLSLLWGSMALARQKQRELDATQALVDGIIHGLSGAMKKPEPVGKAWESRGSDRPN